MSHPTMYSVAARASRSIDLSPQAKTTDGGLLTRFIQTKDETAFAELVRRLGPMVLGVCRRITGDIHLAEDAFQAAFIVLARRANDIRMREQLRGWLYGVAVRTAKRARAVSIHRCAHEVAVPSLPDRPVEPAEPSDTDALRLLDEEVGALPNHQRIVVVLCELEGQCRKEVAQNLGIPEGTLSSRLAAARKRLAERLRQRGIVLSAAGLSVALTQLASAQPSVDLVAKATIAATRETIPPNVASISHGVLRIMFLDKLKTTIPLALLAAGLIACVTVAATPPQIPPILSRTLITKPILFATTYADPPPAKVDPKPLPKGPNKLLFWRAGNLTMIDPDGKNEKDVCEDRSKIHPATETRLSPDGKKLAVLESVGIGGDPPPPGDQKHKLYVCELGEKETVTDLDITCLLFAWSPDGTQIATSDSVDGPDVKIAAVHYLVNVKTKEKKSLKLPEDHIITDWSRDGKYFVTTSVTQKDGKKNFRIHLMNMDGTEHKALTGENDNALIGRISPDGTRLLFHTFQPPKEKGSPARRELQVLDIVGGKKTLVSDLPLNGEIQGYCWSPNGKQIAYTWREIHEGKPEDIARKETASHVVVSDPDGKNQQIIASEKGETPVHITIGEVDWR
jgi:RNA polymerase sigma factor (sigma-70 family)